MTQNALPLLLRRHRQLDAEVESPNRRVIPEENRIRQPKSRHRIFFQDAVKPTFCAAYDIISILGFIKHNERFALGEKTLRRLHGAQALRPFDRVAIFIFRRHLEQLAVQPLRQHPSQLGFAGAGGAVKQDVDPGAAGGEGFFQVGAQNRQLGLQVWIVIHGQLRGRTEGDHASQQIHGL